MKPPTDRWKTVSGVFLFLIIIVAGFIAAPLMLNSYAPMTGMFHQGERVYVSGYVKYENGTAAVGVEVTLWATDESQLETLYTNEHGWFTSELMYEAGQLVVVEIMGRRRDVFIPYFAEAGSDFSIGTFWLPPDE